jgi:hypothetical protein
VSRLMIIQLCPGCGTVLRWVYWLPRIMIVSLHVFDVKTNEYITVPGLRNSSPVGVLVA